MLTAAQTIKQKERDGRAEPLAVSIAEAARLLGGVHPRTVARMVADNRLRSCKVSRRVMVPVAAIRELVDGEAGT